nr:DNA (cytosine-5)-methyltransferase 1-like [Ipomoea batatas]
MAYYQSPRKWAASTSSRNEVSWIARATGITSEGNNPHYYYGMSINGVLVTSAPLCLSTSLTGVGAPPFVSRNTCFNPQTRQSPSHFEESQNGNQSVIEDDANLMPKTYVICQFVLVDTPSSPVKLNPNDKSPDSLTDYGLCSSAKLEMAKVGCGSVRRWTLDMGSAGDATRRDGGGARLPVVASSLLLSFFKATPLADGEVAGDTAKGEDGGR